MALTRVIADNRMAKQGHWGVACGGISDILRNT